MLVENLNLSSECVNPCSNPGLNKVSKVSSISEVPGIDDIDHETSLEALEPLICERITSTNEKGYQMVLRKHNKAQQMVCSLHQVYDPLNLASQSFLLLEILEGMLIKLNVRRKVAKEHLKAPPLLVYEDSVLECKRA